MMTKEQRKSYIKIGSTVVLIKSPVGDDRFKCILNVHGKVVNPKNNYVRNRTMVEYPDRVKIPIVSNYGFQTYNLLTANLCVVNVLFDRMKILKDY